MKKILVFNPYFLPGYKAGGPIQSLANMINTLGDQYSFSVITAAYDLNEVQPYASIQLAKWNTLSLGKHNIPVWYTGKRLKISELNRLLQEVQPDIVFINGMYGWNFFLGPLVLSKRVTAIPHIISPRGMLQPGALAVKPLKKKIYYVLLKLSGLLKNVYWHATTPEEQDDIEQLVGKKAVIHIAGNIPKRPTPIQPSMKREGVLRLVYISLVTEKKNLLLLLGLLQKTSATIELDIYGPVKDALYWKECVRQMEQMPALIQVQYKGAVQPDQVQETIARYDAMILLTKGENFGHALFESFSVGRPVITSFFTPWNELQAKQAGWNVDIHQPQTISSLLEQLAQVDNESWQLYCEGAYRLANHYFEEQHFEEAYKALFEY
ncbi:MAG: glycosyltransferase [Bacteroidota bacterium]|nr:glycosyltransferase [Bacteroidota bacterium]